jgi:hypothetical protein
LSDSIVEIIIAALLITRKKKKKKKDRYICIYIEQNMKYVYVCMYICVESCWQISQRRIIGMDITQRGDISQGKATYLSEDEASHLNYRLMIVYHDCRVSREGSDLPFSQTRGLRESLTLAALTESVTPCQ